MKKNIQLPNWLQTESIKELFNVIEASGKEIRFVGGCIRDALMGIESKDIDLAINARPDTTIQILKAKGIRAIPTGIDYGTVTVLLKGKTVEITSLRKDTDCDGRHAIVEYTDSWEEDASRRDFTMNTIYADIDGNLYDYCDGIKDINNKTVRFVGNAAKRVEEDTLRILRYYRFLASHGDVASIDAEAAQACRIYAIQLPSLSGERIQTEIRKLLDAKNAPEALTLMIQHKILQYIDFPVDNTESLRGLIELAASHPEITIDPVAKMAVLIRSSVKEGRSAAMHIANRWCLSRRDGILLLQYTAPNKHIDAALTLPEQKRLLRKLQSKQIYLNHLAISAAESQLEGTFDANHFKQMVHTAIDWDIPQFSVAGQDILAIGIPTGKVVGSILKAAEKWWEEQNYAPEKEEILQHIQRVLIPDHASS